MKGIATAASAAQRDTHTHCKQAMRQHLHTQHLASPQVEAHACSDGGASESGIKRTCIVNTVATLFARVRAPCCQL